MRKLTEEEQKKLVDFIAGDVRFRGMSIKDAEAMAFSLLFKWKGDFENFLENAKFDAKMIIESLKNR